VSTREAIMKMVESVPSLPPVVIKLRQMLSDPEVEFQDLARAIEIEPGLTANILHLANSALLRGNEAIGSVHAAITRLGMRRVYDLTLAMSVVPFASRQVRGYALAPNVLWEHSLATALCADELRRKLKIRKNENAFTAGLLHDIGKIVLGTFVEIDDMPIKELCHNDLSFDEAEQQILGVDHAEIGAHLLEKWGLPESVVLATRWHHAPSGAKGENQAIVDLVHVADILCTSLGWGLGADGLHYRLDSTAAQRLGVTAEIADPIMCRVQGELEELSSLVHVNREGSENVPEPAHS